MWDFPATSRGRVGRSTPPSGRSPFEARGLCGGSTSTATIKEIWRGRMASIGPSCQLAPVTTGCDCGIRTRRDRRDRYDSALRGGPRLQAHPRPFVRAIAGRNDDPHLQRGIGKLAIHRVAVPRPWRRLRPGMVFVYNSKLSRVARRQRVARMRGVAIADEAPAAEGVDLVQREFHHPTSIRPS